GTGTIVAGQLTGTINVPVLGDNAIEADETLTVFIYSASHGTIATSTATGTILNDDPSISINNASVTEGNSGTTNAAFTVSLAASSPQDIAIHYATSNGTATSGSDFTSTSGTLTIAAGQTSATISVPVLGDHTDEANETFSLTLTSA